jgi:hypothetical protein
MAIANISERGLLTIAILVIALWGCWLGQRQYLCQARQNIHRAAKDIQELRRKARRTLPSEFYGRPPISRTAVI